jgi:hypothetical protein
VLRRFTLIAILAEAYPVDGAQFTCPHAPSPAGQERRDPMDELESGGGGRNAIVLVVALLVLGAVLAMLYKSASNRDLPDDEWFDFEHPS